MAGSGGIVICVKKGRGKGCPGLFVHQVRFAPAGAEGSAAAAAVAQTVVAAAAAAAEQDDEDDDPEAAVAAEAIVTASHKEIPPI